MKANDDIYKDLLRDFCYELRSLALDAKRQRSEETASEFDVGYLTGFHRVVSLLQQQAEAFGIELKDLNLQGVDPDLDLI